MFPENLSGTFNLLTPKDSYSGRTAPLTSKRCILYIYSTNTGTEYFKHGIYCPFFSLQNAVCFIILTNLVPVLFTFCIQGVLKLKKKFRRQKVKLHSNVIRIAGTVPEGLCTLMIISRLSFLRIRHVTEKVCREKKFMVNFFLSKKKKSFMR